MTGLWAGGGEDGEDFTSGGGCGGGGGGGVGVAWGGETTAIRRQFTL